MTLKINDLISSFKSFSDIESPRVFFAPGRVNLIGEHVDYNGGHVFPCALNIGTYAIIGKRDDKKVRMYSMNFKDMGVVEFSLDNLVFDKVYTWTNYPKGVLNSFGEFGFKIAEGFDVLFYGDIPNAAGLSSSASIEMVTATMLKELFDISVDALKMIQICQYTENNFIGVNCGIMDQFAIGMGKKDNAVLLNTNNNKYRHVPLVLGEYCIVIGNTNKKRGLTNSKYNQRRLECDKALEILKKHVNISSLGDMSNEEFDNYKEYIKDETILKRARHAVSENQRTLQAAKELEKGNLEMFGKIMKMSHKSLKTDYEVTGLELDTLVELSQNFEGVIGSRMTGAGFGGCTVNIVRKDRVEAFINSINSDYKKVIGYDADFYVVEAGNGSREIIF